MKTYAHVLKFAAVYYQLNSPYYVRIDPIILVGRYKHLVSCQPPNLRIWIVTRLLRYSVRRLFDFPSQSEITRGFARSFINWQREKNNHMSGNFRLCFFSSNFLETALYQTLLFLFNIGYGDRKLGFRGICLEKQPSDDKLFRTQNSLALWVLVHARTISLFVTTEWRMVSQRSQRVFLLLFLFIFKAKHFRNQAWTGDTTGKANRMYGRHTAPKTVFFRELTFSSLNTVLLQLLTIT